MPDPLRLLALTLLCSVAIFLSSGPPAGAVGTSECTQDWRPAAVAAYLTADGRATDPPQLLAPAPSPEHRAFHVFCDGHYVSTVWWSGSRTIVEVVRATRDLLAHPRYPSVRIGVNPRRGITGLASWFWATPDPNPVHLLPGNGPGVELWLTITDVDWSFGDARGFVATGLGAPYPQPSPVTHVYERRGAYDVATRVRLVGRYSYQELLDDVPGTSSVTARHDVVEVRSLLHLA